MQSRSCIRYTRPDGTTAICLYCEGITTARKKGEEMDEAGLSVVNGVCPICIDRYKMDSVRGTPLELLGCVG